MLTALEEQRRLDRLRELVRTASSVTSVYVHGARPGAGVRDLALRWLALRSALSDQGAPNADLDALEGVVLATRPGDHTTAAFAADGQVWWGETLVDFAAGDVAVHGRWPRLLPLLRWQEWHAPVVVAIAHHGTAQIWAYDDNGELVGTDDVVGADDEIERNAPGGWAQPRYRRRAEDSWEHNADQFAAHVTRLVARLRPPLVLLAGDERERQLVRDRLPRPVRGIAEEVTSQPAADGTVQVPGSVVRAAVRACSGRRLMAMLADFDETTGRRLTVEGAADVAKALDAGRASRLIVVDGVVPLDLADTLIAAALDADTEVAIADSDDVHLAGGVGAVLRY